jgi:myo-inositol-1(or 4)-monophosphatase
MDHSECVAGNPRIYGQMVATLAKYSKFAGAGDKATVRQALQEDTASLEPVSAADQPADKPKLTARKIKAGAARPDAPDAPV